MNLVFHLVLILISTCCCNCIKLLILLTNPGRSHFYVFKPLVIELNRRGHNITMVAHFSSGLSESNSYRELILKDENKEAVHIFDLEKNMPNLNKNRKDLVLRIRERSFIQCNSSLSQDVMRNLIAEKDQYDLILLEYFSNDCFFGFIDKFRIPVVGLSTTSILPWHNDRFGNIENPSYIPNAFSNFNTKMNFWDRMSNLFFVELYKYHYDTYISKVNEYFAEKFFNSKIAFKKDFITNYSSLMLVNTHYSLNIARPLVPSVIEVGGIHIGMPEKLPKNIEKFINESTHGVIYFSLGSMIKGHTFPQEKKEEFLRAFARLPQRVLWKWENETMPGKPDNVMIQKWMPQFDILSHPNVKAFISHGGLLGVTEAVHCGVPMIVMPQYGDQHTNAKAVEANGGGVILYLREATEEKVYQNLKTILDPEFRSKAKALSERFRDRPMSPMDTAIYWIEYVARHKGAPHMRTAAVDMPLYQYLLLDVFAFLAVVLIIFLYISYKISSLILRAIFSKKKLKQN